MVHMLCSTHEGSATCDLNFLFLTFQMDKLFDMLNSSSPFGRGFKSPLTRSNIEFKEKSMNDTIEYLHTLKLLTEKPIGECPRKTFVIGFETAVRSFVSLAKDTVNEYPDIKYLRGYQLGQDHIETLFSKIRAKGGFNNNPDVAAFRYALRSLLVKSDITPSSSANCIELDARHQSGNIGSLIFRPKKKQKESQDQETDSWAEEFADEDTETEELSIQLTKPIIDISEYIGNYCFIVTSGSLRCTQNLRGHLRIWS